MSTPAAFLNSSPAICIGEPLPAVAKAMPGSFFASATSSGSVFTPSVGFTTRIIGVDAGMITGTRSFITSTPPPAPLGSRCGEIAMVLGATSIVYPSAGALATALAPARPPTPGRFSTITGCPIRGGSFSERMRAKRSIPPPGGKGTTIVSGLDGKACACAAIGRARAAAQAATARARRVRVLKVRSGSWSADSGIGLARVETSVRPPGSVDASSWPLDPVAKPQAPSRAFPTRCCLPRSRYRSTAGTRSLPPSRRACCRR